MHLQQMDLLLRHHLASQQPQLTQVGCSLVELYALYVFRTIGPKAHWLHACCAAAACISCSNGAEHIS